MEGKRFTGFNSTFARIAAQVEWVLQEVHGSICNPLLDHDAG